MPTRRQLLTGTLASIGAIPVATLFYTWRMEPHWLEIVHRNLPVADLPPELDGCSLVHLSDLHTGPKVDDDYLVRTLQRVSALQPDFVAITGDWITYRESRQFVQLERVLQHLPLGRRGTVGILGNHDYGFDWNMLEVADRVARIVQDAGVRLLRDQAVTFDGFQFLGLEDLWGPRFGAKDLLHSHAEDRASIVLCHNPDTVDRPVWGSYEGWILAGHTHGGQCKLPFLPPPLLPVANRRYTAGEFSLGGRRRLYISRGVGHLLKVRFNVRPEVTVFRLVKSREVAA